MRTGGKIKHELFILPIIGIVGFFTACPVFAQYDYYDPYSNSNVDYFPMNPIRTSPSRTGSSGTVGGTPGGTVSGGTTSTTTSGGTTSAATSCTNKPKANPQDTRSVEIRDKSGKVFYLSPPKEEIVGIRAYPEISQQIFKIIYGASGMQEREYVTGLITVNNQCYPKYGYVQSNSVAAPKASPSASSPSDTQNTQSNTVPEHATAVNLDPATGEVFNAKTGEPINDARYDAAARKIYYKNTQSTFGKVFTDTTGYVNIDVRGLESVPALPPPPSLPTVRFKDVSPSDHYITAMVGHMVKSKTYTVPNNKKFGPAQKVKGSFALQVLAAVSEAGCGSETKYPGPKKCKEHLVREGVVDKNFPLNGYITRGDFYKFLLNARGIPLEEAAGEDPRTLCKDGAKLAKDAVQVLLTAEKYGIASKYNGECRLLKTFSQKEALQFAVKTLEADTNDQ